MIADELFWSKVAKGGPDDCWEWQGQRQLSGHGNVKRRALSARSIGAHRYSWYLATGSMPGDLCVCHRCDNPPCVNPAHLFLGSQADNLRDMREKGRGRNTPAPRGIDNQNAYVPDEVIREIRETAASGMWSQKAIARRYGLGETTISTWVRGVTRADAGGPMRRAS